MILACVFSGRTASANFSLVLRHVVVAVVVVDCGQLPYVLSMKFSSCVDHVMQRDLCTDLALLFSGAVQGADLAEMDDSEDHVTADQLSRLGE